MSDNRDEMSDLKRILFERESLYAKADFRLTRREGVLEKVWRC